jgi:hypothetical protein
MIRTTGDDPMAVRIELGLTIECTDGPAGTLRDVVLDPVHRRLTHLVVDRHHHLAHLVTIEEVDRSAGGSALRLRCRCGARALPTGGGDRLRASRRVAAARRRGRRGHLWRRRDITIPVDAITQIGTDSIELSLTPDGVAALPSVPGHRHRPASARRSPGER